jgi:hypothetical protein
LAVLSSLARGASEADRGERLAPTPLLDAILRLARQPAAAGAGAGAGGAAAGSEGAARLQCACLDALAALAYDGANRRRFLQSPGLMGLLTELASAPPPGSGGGGGDAPNPPASPAAAPAAGVAAAGEGPAPAPALEPATAGGDDGEGADGGAAPITSRGGSGDGALGDSVACVAAAVTGSGPTGRGALRAELVAPVKRTRSSSRGGGGSGGGGGRGGAGATRGGGAVDGPALVEPRLYAIRLLALLGVCVWACKGPGRAPWRLPLQRRVALYPAALQRPCPPFPNHLLTPGWHERTPSLAAY